MKTILIAFDNTLTSEVALDQARIVARQWQAEIVVLHCRPAIDPPAVHKHTGPSAERWRSSFDDYLASGQRRADFAVEGLRGQGIAARLEVASHYPDSALLTASRETPCHLAVVGWPPDGVPRPRAAAKIAERVARQSNVPVLVARERSQRSDQGFARILVPTDFSTTAKAALVFALDIAQPVAEMELFHCWEPSVAIWPYFEGDSAAEPETEPHSMQLANHAQALGERLVADHRRPGIELNFRDESRKPVDGIFERARSAPFDLIVMGTHGRRGVRRWVMGSVAEDTVRNAPCSVVVVPPHGDY